MKSFLALLLTSCSVFASPNIVLILADNLGWTDLGCYGATWHETPSIDRLATNGMRFTSAYATAKCSPSRACIQSGQSSARTGIYNVGTEDFFNWMIRPLRPAQNVVNLPLENVTIAEALKPFGYRTALFGKWHLGSGAYHPANQGYDEAIMTPQGKFYDFQTSPPIGNLPGDYLTDVLTDLSVDFIERNATNTFLLVLEHYAVHAPRNMNATNVLYEAPTALYEAPAALISYFENKPHNGGYLTNASYAASLASLDQSVGRVVSKLEEMNIATNTIVIFMSDNGGVGSETWRRNTPLRDGIGTYYEGGIRVPMIAWMPETIAPGVVSSVPVHAVDLYPTLLSMANVSFPTNHVLDGTSFADVLTGDGTTTNPRPPLRWHFPSYEAEGQDEPRATPLSAIRAGDWKLIEFFESGDFELFNLSWDLGESTNLAAAYPEKVSELFVQLDDWRESLNAYIPTNHGFVDVAPFIVTQPTDMSISPGQPAGFRVNALSTEPLAYQWFVGGVELPGWTASQPGMTNAAPGVYSVMVSNSLGSVLSSNATLRIYGPPEITTQPISKVVGIGKQASFIIELTSFPLAGYQWFFNGVPMDGITGRSLVLTNCQHSMAGQYHVIASNAYGIAASQSATLTILDPWIYQQPASTNLYAGQNIAFLVKSLFTAPAFHQWYFNGQPLLNSTNRWLTIVNANASHSGQYQLSITSPNSTVWSDVATVDVRFVGPMEQFAGFRIYAPTGTVATVEYTLDLVNWNVLTNLAIPTYPFLFIDQEPLDPQRFYRAVLTE